LVCPRQFAAGQTCQRPQAAYRFFKNPRVRLQTLAEPLLEAARQALPTASLLHCSGEVIGPRICWRCLAEAGAAVRMSSTGVGAGAEEAGGKIGGGERGGSENFIRRVGIALDWMIAVQMA